MVRSFFISISVLALLTACGSLDVGTTNKPAEQSAEKPAEQISIPMTPTEQNKPPAKGEQIAIIQTNKGVIKIKFFPDVAPETVKNFTELVKKDFYNGLIFHRIIPDFMIQGGDPKGDGTGGETYKGPGTTLKAEFSTKLKHERGAVSMARKGNDVNSASSQFFIVQNVDGANFLDGQYTVFGQVFEGIDVVDAIVKEKRDANDKPFVSQVMESVTIESAK